MKKKNESKLALFFGLNRSSRAIAVSGVLTVLLLIVLVAVNLAAGLIPQSIAKPDVTGKETFKISAKTTSWLETLDENVTLYLICDGGKAAADGDILSFLSRYEDASRHIKLEVIDSSSDEAFIMAHGGEWPADLSVVVESESRYRIIDNTDLYYYYFYNASYGSMSMTPDEYATMLEYYAANDTTGETLALFVESTTPYFDGESRVTNAINYVTLDRVATVYALTGNGATELDSTLTEYLSDSSFDMRTLLQLSALPEDCDVLVINAPTADLTEDEAAVLSAYLAGGGKLFLTTMFNAASMPNLAAVLNTYGLGFEETQHILCEGHTNYQMSDSSTSYPYLFYTHIASDHAATGDFDGQFVSSYAHAIKLTETEGVTLTPWLYTSAVGYLLSTEGKQIGEKGEYTLGAIAESGETQIVWIASPSSLTATGNSYSSNGNFQLTLSALNHLCGVANDAIAIESRVLETSILSVTGTQFIVLGVILVLILPIATAAIGIGVWFVRKKR